MELKEMIYRRKSTRSFTSEPVDEVTIQKIKAFAAGAKTLYPDIKVRAEIVGRENVKCICPWTTQQLLVIYSEDKEGSMENVGFIFQQVDLYIQSLGLGVCWLGMGRLNEQGTVEAKTYDGLNYVIMLAFGHPKGEAVRRNVAEFRRKTLSEIDDKADERLEPARLAPSSVNSQPWYFVHEGEIIHTYCALQGFFKSKALSNMNRIDIGIALAHLYISNKESFAFFKADRITDLPGYIYIGSVIL